VYAADADFECGARVMTTDELLVAFLWAWTAGQFLWGALFAWRLWGMERRLLDAMDVGDDPCPANLPTGGASALPVNRPLRPAWAPVPEREKPATGWQATNTPTHRCRECGALWRYWRAEASFGEAPDQPAWERCSVVAGACCERAPGPIVEPATVWDVIDWWQHQ